MNRRRFTLAALTGSTVLGLAACGIGGGYGTGGSGADGEDRRIAVASHLPPMTDVVTTAAEVAAEEGWTIELVQVSDNVQYNRLLADGEVDANFAQHEPYMQAFNEANDAHLVALDAIYDAKVGFYSKAHTSIDEIPEEARVAIPNDASNEGRALAILHEHGVITLPEDAGFTGRVGDIVDNPLALEFVQVDLLNLSSAYDEDGIALVYNYPTYIAKVGLTPADALLLEETVDQRFAISLVAREEDRDSEKIQVLRRAMTSDTVRTFLEEEHSDTLLPSF
ncbi:MetQ/NlpA family ABC transporter substrate-binding protein [Brachybacterium sp. YJGR34]|uniref:MetQ/NlpA family ABC transporter substrate-binding protein n=1 Tax=Brachybacterium sp. YJGR34 TaxID=2059911 RepID=UPI000E0B9C3E|nr:MetQ/NlpA family ABC transporter substrate-binding protein [Brachybacterium sp. YJGR34]